MSFQNIEPASTVPSTISGLLAAYRDGSLQPEQVVSRLWHNWQQTSVEQDTAWITHADASFLQAQLAALKGHSPDTLPLYGIPFAIKDNIDVAGLPTTAACPAFTYQPLESAEVIKRLTAAGAIAVGKTNLDQFATGLVGMRSPYGAPSSTFSEDHISGGSSSGSAVVVARGEVPFSLGTDTAGSGRVPACFNNLVGLKPTPGLIPTQGVLPACKSLDCVSIFALTASDAARVLQVTEGPLPGAPIFNSVTQQPPRLPHILRIGVPIAPDFHGDADYKNAFDEAQHFCLNLTDQNGEPWAATLVPVDMQPFIEVSRLLYEGPWVAERYAAIAEFIKCSPQDINPVVMHIIDGARQYDAVSAFNGQYKLRELAARTLPVWQDIDVLLVPTAPTMPTKASVEADPIGRNAQLGTYTNFVNLLGLAALALPSGYTPYHLPFGVTFIAPGGSDAALLDLGSRWQIASQQNGPYPLGHGLPSANEVELTLPCCAVKAEPVIALAVVGAHLSGMPLHWQMVERKARLLMKTHTTPRYKLYALPGTVPPKPALARLDEDASSEDAHAIAVEVYAMPISSVGSFLALILSPLGLGSIELTDGTWVKGFICEPYGISGAQDISHFGGWRAYIAHIKTQASTVR